jgi:hypothetical protein
MYGANGANGGEKKENSRRQEREPPKKTKAPTGKGKRGWALRPEAGASRPENKKT